IWFFSNCPEDTVDYLQKHLRPVMAPDRKIIFRYITELADNRYQVRRQAFEQLKALGELPIPALRLRLGANPSPEQRLRIEELIEEARNCFSGDKLRALREIQILEYIGSPRAKLALQHMADGAPESVLTVEAKLSVSRLK